MIKTEIPMIKGGVTRRFLPDDITTKKKKRKINY